MLGEPGSGDKDLDRQFAQTRLDLGLEYRRVSMLAFPCANRALVFRVLAAADLASMTAVRGIALLRSQASEHRRRVVPSLLCMCCPALCAAVCAVAFAAIG